VYIRDLFSTDPTAYDAALESFTKDLLSGKWRDAYDAIDQFDDYAGDIRKGPKKSYNKSQHLKRYGDVWAIAVWLGVGQQLQEEYLDGYDLIDTILHGVAREVPRSQQALILSVRGTITVLGHGFYVGLRSRGIYLPTVPPKNLVEKLSAVVKRQSTMASVIDKNRIGPIDYEHNLDLFARICHQWLRESWLDAQQIVAYEGRRRPLSTSDLNHLLEHVRHLPLEAYIEHQAKARQEVPEDSPEPDSPAPESFSAEVTHRE
jgi:hypothetical protein